MGFLGIGALTVVVVTSPRPASAGSELALEWDHPIAAAQASAGEILAWAGHTLRWRAPAVCAQARVDVRLQSADGHDESLSFEVTPADPPAPLVIIPAVRPDSWEVQAFRESDVAFVGQPGQLVPGERSGACHRATWSMPDASHPDVAVVAVFEGPKLWAWRPVPRASRGYLEIESKAGTAVVVVVGGRRFRAMADEDHVARLHVEIPPGERRAEVIGEQHRTYIELDPPPVTTEHRIAAPDGARWLLRNDARGIPADGPAPPGAMRWSEGAYRWPPSTEIVRAAPEPAATDTFPRGRALRIGVGMSTGPSWRPGGFASIGAAWAAGRWAIGPSAILLLSGARQRFASDGTDVRRASAGLGVLAEAAMPLRLGHWRISPTGSVGIASELERLSSDADPALLRWGAGPLGTVALRAGSGRLDFELRAIVSNVTLGLDSSGPIWMAGLGWSE